MEKSDDLPTKNEMDALRQGIKNKYRQYHLTDPSQFPDFEYNTNRANYEPLRTSFERELYVIRGVDRVNPNIHIPSTNTLALIYTSEGYVPGKKILSTCRLYTEGYEATPTNASPIASSNVQLKTPKRVVAIRLAGFAVLLIGLASYFLVRYYHNDRQTGELVVFTPVNMEGVSRLLSVEGRAINADTVWVAVRPAGSPEYYIQTPVKVDSRGHWKGIAIIGSTHKANRGIKFQIRTFTKPEEPLMVGDVLNEWPVAERSSNIVEVVRGAEVYASPSDDPFISKPYDGQTVPCELSIEGRATDADTIWVVIKPEGNLKFWVQAPIPVEKNGRWAGKVYVGEPGMADVGWLYKIRAFVNPVDPLKVDDILYEWPKAKRSSGAINVIRGPNDK